MCRSLPAGRWRNGSGQQPSVLFNSTTLGILGVENVYPVTYACCVVVIPSPEGHLTPPCKLPRPPFVREDPCFGMPLPADRNVLHIDDSIGYVLCTYIHSYITTHTHTHTHTQFIPPGGPNPKGQLSCNLLIHIYITTVTSKTGFRFAFTHLSDARTVYASNQPHRVPSVTENVPGALG